MKCVTLLKTMSLLCLLVVGMARAEDLTTLKLHLKFTKNFVITDKYNACDGHCLRYKLTIMDHGFQSPAEFLAGEEMYVYNYSPDGDVTLLSEESMKAFSADNKEKEDKAHWLRLNIRYADDPSDRKYLKSEILAMLKSLGYFTVTMGWQ